MCVAGARYSMEEVLWVAIVTALASVVSGKLRSVNANGQTIVKHVDNHVVSKLNFTISHTI